MDSLHSSPRPPTPRLGPDSVRLPSRSLERRRGSVSILITITFLVVLGFAALALDSAHVYLTAGQLETAADSAALAGVGKLQKDSTLNQWMLVRQAAIDAAHQNEAADVKVSLGANTANSANGDIVVGIWTSATKTFTPSTLAPNAVKVNARRTEGSSSGALPLFFGPAFGAETSDVSGSAIALLTVSPGPNVLVLHPTSSAAFSMKGNMDLDVLLGSVQVNSAASGALSMNGNTTITASATRVHGTVSMVGGASIVGSLEENAAVVPDPLASLPDPSWNAAANLGTIGGTGTFSPGYYSGGIDMNGGLAVLQAGTYVLGAGIDMKGNGTVTDNGAGVHLFIPNGAGTINVRGGASVVLKPPSSGTYQGVMVFQGRGNTNIAAIGGNGLLNFEGCIYLPAATFHMGGTSDLAIGQVIVNKLDVRGNSEITGLSVPTSTTSMKATLVH